MQKNRAYGRKILSLCCIFTGLSLFFYPRIREGIQKYETNSQAEASRNRVDEKEDAAVEEMWEAARQYNRKLTEETAVLTDPFISGQEQESIADYESLLAVGENGLMGFIEIPSIDIFLPIYHGTAAETLEMGIGHLEGSSLPAGGEGTHAVLSGHTGLQNAKMFTDLDELKEEDVFLLHILDQELVYRVREIAVVTPSDISRLMIQSGKDLCTLVTCTPYGINSHRLLVTGERVEALSGTDRNGDEEVTEKVRWGKKIVWGAGLALGLLIVLFPVFSEHRFRRQSERYIEEQRQKANVGQMAYEEENIPAEHENSPTQENMRIPELFREAEKYNRHLADEGQSVAGDPSALQALPQLTAETEESGVGYIDIPAMDVSLPLFIGASEDHLARGAAILEGTSLPLGETSSHVVISAHRGYRGIPFFRDIEQLDVGDLIYVTTLWESYVYRAEAIQIIEPDNTEALAIQPGQDLLTLMSCHPYLSGGKSRYLVYCIRDSSAEGADWEEEAEDKGEAVLNWESSSDSRKLILGEKVLRFLGICGIGTLFFVKIRQERRGTHEI